jgi:hypothetical protein
MFSFFKFFNKFSEFKPLWSKIFIQINLVREFLSKFFETDHRSVSIYQTFSPGGIQNTEPIFQKQDFSFPFTVVWFTFYSLMSCVLWILKVTCWCNVYCRQIRLPQHAKKLIKLFVHKKTGISIFNVYSLTPVRVPNKGLQILHFFCL